MSTKTRHINWFLLLRLLVDQRFERPILPVSRKMFNDFTLPTEQPFDETKHFVNIHGSRPADTTSSFPRPPPPHHHHPPLSSPPPLPPCPCPSLSFSTTALRIWKTARRVITRWRSLLEWRARGAASVASTSCPSRWPSSTLSKMNPFQREAVQALEDGHSVLVSAHTSTGKMVVTEYACAMALRDGECDPK